MRKNSWVFLAILANGFLMATAWAADPQTESPSEMHPAFKRETLAVELGFASLWAVMPLVNANVYYVPPFFDQRLNVFLEYKSMIGAPSDLGQLQMFLLGAHFDVYRHETLDSGSTRIYVSFSPLSLLYSEGSFTGYQKRAGAWAIALSPLVGLGINMTADNKIGIFGKIEIGVLGNIPAILPSGGLHFGF